MLSENQQELLNALANAPVIDDSTKIQEKKKVTFADLPDEDFVPTAENDRKVPKKRGRPPGSKNRANNTNTNPKPTSTTTITSAQTKSSTSSASSAADEETDKQHEAYIHTLAEDKMKILEGKKKMQDNKTKGTTASIPNIELTTTGDKDKDQLLRQIRGYYNNFPWLKDGYEKRTPISSNSTVKALKDEVNRMQSELSGKRALQTLHILDTVAVGLAGNIACLMGFTSMPFEVVASTMRSPIFMEQIQDELKELSILYEDYLSIGPEIRYVGKRVSQFIEVIKGEQAKAPNPPAKSTRPSTEEEHLQNLKAMFNKT